MAQATQSELAHGSAMALLDPKTDSLKVSRDREIRFLAASMVREGRLLEADRLTREALEKSPLSEEILAIRSLVLEVRQDWTEARQTLQRLLAVQGDSAPVETWCHWVRVLRCEGLAERALDETVKGLIQFPGHPTLVSELEALQNRSQPTPQMTA